MAVLGLEPSQQGVREGVERGDDGDHMNLDEPYRVRRRSSAGLSLKFGAAGVYGLTIHVDPTLLRALSARIRRVTSTSRIQWVVS